MNIFVPDIGTKIKLTEGWIFQLYQEYRNNSIFEALGNNTENLKKVVYAKDKSYWNPNLVVEKFYYEMFLPADSILTVRRVYIRNGKGDYSSLTFTLNETTHPFLAYNKEKKKKKTCGQFWAKLSDVNQIKCEIIKDTAKVFSPLEDAENNVED